MITMKTKSDAVEQRGYCSDKIVLLCFCLDSQVLFLVKGQSGSVGI